MEKLLTVSIAAAFLLGFAASEEPDRIDWEESDFEYLHENIEASELKDEINANNEEIPSFVENIVGDQRINVDFQETNATYGAEMNGTKVEKLGTEEVDNPTLQVNVNESSLDAVMSSEHGFEELREQMDKGGIEYEALTTTNRIRFFLTERVLDIFSFIDL